MLLNVLYLPKKRQHHETVQNEGIFIAQRIEREEDRFDNWTKKTFL